MTQELLVEVSPHGTLEAVVAQDDRVAYFYLRPITTPDFGLKSCWLGNLRRAPWRLDVKGMQRGAAPMLPKKYCRGSAKRPPLEGINLEVVWYPEGDGATLLEGGQLLAEIPPWSGSSGFHGYSRSCTSESPLCWPLAPAKRMVTQRLESSRSYWASWSENSPWPTYQEAYLNALESVLGTHERYFAIDEQQWPPKAIALFDCGTYKIAATVGVGLVPQPQVGLAFKDSVPHRRFEFAIGFAHDLPEEDLQRLLSYVSAQTQLPWHKFTFVANGHTIPCDSMPRGNAGQGFPAVLLLTAPENAPAIATPSAFGEPTNLLWMVPLTLSERDFALSASSAALAEKLKDQPTAWRSGGR